jgi:adenylosuccinate lyase
MIECALTSVGPIDGRYSSKTYILHRYFSEFALIHYRLQVEVKWLLALSHNDQIHDIPPISKQGQDYLTKLVEQFDTAAAEKVKNHEKRTNHDVKAVEYYLRDCIENHEELKSYIPFIHFACTSEDINNVAYALMLKDALQHVIEPSLAEIMGGIMLLGKQYGAIPMLSRTHGQPATPTTIGKELLNFVARMKRPQQQLLEVLIPAKFNGAVGNYNAHMIAYPDINWRAHCQAFIKSLGLSFNAYTTQIEPHDGIAEVSFIMTRINNILLDYAKDMWQYISLNYFKQKAIANEVGSSTMPHKINPIDFENAEGNLGLANALFTHFANKLTQSRGQRDLSDSTVLRNLGVAFAYSLIAFQALAKGNDKLEINEAMLQKDLDDNWQVLAEAVQTVMRRYRVPDAYEKLKHLTRGQGITAERLAAFIDEQPIPEEAKERLRQLTPSSYIGLAAVLAKAFS